MKRSSIMLVCALVGLGMGLSSCGPKKPDDGSLLSGKVKTPEHFRYIPADTPFLIADMAPFPYDQLDWDVFASANDSIKAARKGMESSAASPDAAERVVMATLEELDGRMNKKGMGELGLTLGGHLAAYAIGAFPVARVGIADKAKFEAFVGRVEKKAGVKVPVKEFKGIKFRELRKQELVVVMAVVGREVIIGGVEKNYRDEFLSYAFGLKKPAKSLYNNNKLRAMQKKYGWTPYLSGYVDLKQISDVMTGVEKSTLMATSLKAAGAPLPQLDADCQREYGEMSAQAPRLVFGYSQLTRNTITFATGLEAKGELLKTMKAVRAPVPGYDPKTADKTFVSAGVGVNMEQLVNVLTQKAVDIQRAPYKCRNLAQLNETIRKVGTQSGQVPPIVQSLRGVSVELRDLDLDLQAKKLTKLQVLAMLKTTDPAALFGLLKTTYPPLANATLTPDSPPVSVPYPPNMQNETAGLPAPQLAMTKTGLGLAIGEGMTANMTKRLEAKPSRPNTFLMFGYDISRVFDLIERRAPAEATNDETFKALKRSYSQFGPMRMEVSVEDSGLFMTTHIIMRGKKKAAKK